VGDRLTGVKNGRATGSTLNSAANDVAPIHAKTLDPTIAKNRLPTGGIHPIHRMTDATFIQSIR
jgi:hypothetical protein